MSLIRSCFIVALLLTLAPFAVQMHAQQSSSLPKIETVIHGIDESVKARVDHLAEYTVIEHYTIIRNDNAMQPAAEMTVRTVSRQHEGKNFTVLSKSGSSLYLDQLQKTLDSERDMSLPSKRESVLINSANYSMQLAPTPNAEIAGRHCLQLKITARRSDASLFNGNLWVDAEDFSIVKFEGVAVKSKHFAVSPAHVTRSYQKFEGYPMATAAYATTSAPFIGQITVKIDYRDYQIKLAGRSH